MAPPKILLLACASGFLTAQAIHETAKQTSLIANTVSSTYTVALGNNAVCLEAINDAREAAALGNFTTATSKETLWPGTGNDNADVWAPVCEALITEDIEDAKGRITSADAFKTDTYAFMALDTEAVDCAAAVSHWKAAVSNFISIPPSKAEGGELYKNPQNVSFVAMYNPSASAIADCRVVACTQATTDVGTLNLRSSTEPKKGYALMCMTTPDVMKDNSPAPFTEEQWKKIKSSLTGSASAVAPSLLVVAVAALGLAAL